MFGETPTAKPITVYGIVMFRVSDGRIVEDWEALDEQYLREQVTPVARDP
jgi:predicted ester cyclase